MSTLVSLIPHLQLPLTAEEQSQAQRIFHGRGHVYPNLHHITIDWLPPVILITLFTSEDKKEIKSLVGSLLSKIPHCKSIQLQHRYQLSGPIEIIYGEPIQQLTIQENNRHFHISLGKTRNTGLFLDMRNGRQWVQEHSKNKRVLNLFAYTCGFSIAAIAGGANSVLNIDMSSPALNRGRENHRLNHQSLAQVRFEKLNILNSFGRLKKRGPFDLLICDPPTFQKGSIDIRKDYPKIIRRLKEFMAPNSTLMLCLNAPELDKNFLTKHITELASDYTLIKTIQAPAVYKDAEDKGLKILCFQQN